MTRNDQLENPAMNATQQMQLHAKLKYLGERLTRIQTRLDVYSQSADTYVSANWTYEDDSTMLKNFNSCVSDAQNFLANASCQVKCKATGKYHSTSHPSDAARSCH